MAPILPDYHKNLAPKQAPAETGAAVLIEFIKVPSPGKTQITYWQIIQKPITRYTPSLNTNIARFQTFYCLLATAMIIGFNIYFIVKDLDLKILDGIVVPLLCVYILAVQITMSKCQQRQAQVLEV